MNHLKITFVMNMKIILLLIGIIVTSSNGYVLLQVRKGDNQSNVDALIHKVVPTENIEKIADTARKQFDNYKYKAKKREGPSKDKRTNSQALESIVVAIDSGASPNDANIGKSDAFDRIIQKLSNLLQEGAMTVIPKYRTELEKYHIKPEIVHFRSGKPSVMFEINTKEVIKSIQDFLASKEVKQYADRVANKAAVIYRAVKDEIEKE